jgi:glycosyltransferase involved in cell wall biosynthesis
MNKPLKIALIMQGSRDWMGGVEYIKNIIFALRSLPVEVQKKFNVYLVCNGTVEDGLVSQLSQYLDGVYDTRECLPPATILNRLKWKFRRILKKIDNPRWSDFFKSEKIDFAYPYADNSGLVDSTLSAAWIPDFQHKYLLQFFTVEDIQQRDASFKRIAQQSHLVVLSSKAAEEDFHQFFPDFAHKTKVLTFKTSLAQKIYEENAEIVSVKYNLPKLFFIISNQFWQHKNHLVVLQALSLLKEKNISPNIVCTGHIYDARKPEHSDLILQTIHLLGLSSQIYILGLIPKADQIQLIRRSIAVVQPSLFEGWSTSVEDARCLGKKVILSDLPVHLEQSPPDSQFFDRHSPEQLADLIKTLWDDAVAGPDSEKEAAARELNQAEVRDFGYRFLELASGKVC